jgi:tryptophanyl-tRNA synthetase
LREAIMRIVTDSRLPGEPKDPDSSALYVLFRAFAGEPETAAFRRALEDGIAWGEAKQVLFECIETVVAPMRERYESLMAQPAAIDDILQAGAVKARAIATPKLAALRAAIGLRAGAPSTVAHNAAPGGTSPKSGQPRFASFRDSDGRFRFRLFSADGEELLLSQPFDDPKQAGALQRRIRALGAVAAVLQLHANGLTLELDGETVASTPDYADEQARDDALVCLRDTLERLAAG